MRLTATFLHWYRKVLLGYDLAEVSDEAEAYVRGRYRQLLERRSEPLPAWAWLNALAHGDVADVERLASQAVGGDGPEAFVAGLARDLLEQMAARGVSLEELQRGRLVPLELALARDPVQVFPRSGTHLARAITGALRRGVRPIDPAPRDLGGDPPAAAA